MAALTDRDSNLQPTSQPVDSKKQSAAGEENKLQDVQQNKQLLEKMAQANGYVLGRNWLIRRTDTTWEVV